MSEMGRRDEMEYRRDKLTASIIAAIIRVHQVLGPGFLESIYRNALVLELRKNRLTVETEKEITIIYSGIEVGRHRLDVLVACRVILELKAVQELNLTHYAQLRSYLRAPGLRTGLLVNFFKSHADYRRVEF